jgi:hypothetical protein
VLTLLIQIQFQELILLPDNDYEEDKYRVEGDVDNAGRYVDRKWDNGVQDLEDAPEDAARWTGEEVQRVEDIPDRIENRFDYDRDRIEDIPDRIENRFDNDVDRVEDIPDDVAGKTLGRFFILSSLS